MALALNEYHKLGLVHRNIKPSNIFCLPENDIIKVGVLGLRSLIDKEKYEKMSSLPVCRAPEVLKGKYEVKSDIWSVGCVVYEMLFLKPAFNGNSYEEVMSKIGVGKY
jgi:serine/threonine protein kinase